MKSDQEYLDELIEITTTTIYTGWARRIPAQYKDLTLWIKDKTDVYTPINFMERIYIVINGPPIYCSQGNKCRFVTYTIGYQRSCSRSCKCFSELSSKITIKNQEEYSDKKWKAINDKVTKTCIEKYGACRPTSTKSSVYEDVQIKSKNSCIDRYGKTSYVGSKQQKIDSLEKYGTEYPSQSQFVKDATKQTCLKKYGVEFANQVPEFREAAKYTMLKKYRVENAMYSLELKQKSYDTCVLSGKYIDPVLKTDWEIYKGISHFKGSIDKFIHSENEWKLFKENGLFNSWKNKGGVVRDHIFSRRHGFDYSVFPEIIRHPVNCRIISHRENASKGYISSFSLDELFDNIFCYTRDWYEQQLVVYLIKKYINGERWSNPLKIKEIM